MKVLKPKSWTPHQADRLPVDGYYLSRFTYHNGGVDITLEAIMNGHCFYKRLMPSTFEKTQTPPKWSRLLWSCALTKNHIAKPHECQVITGYETFDHFVKANPDLTLFHTEKAPNDF